MPYYMLHLSLNFSSFIRAASFDSYSWVKTLYASSRVGSWSREREREKNWFHYCSKNRYISKPIRNWWISLFSSRSFCISAGVLARWESDKLDQNFSPSMPQSPCLSDSSSQVLFWDVLHAVRSSPETYVAQRRIRGREQNQKFTDTGKAHILVINIKIISYSCLKLDNTETKYPSPCFIARNIIVHRATARVHHYCVVWWSVVSPLLWV